MEESLNQVEITLRPGVTEDDVKLIPSFTIVISVYLKSDKTVRGISVITISSEFISCGKFSTHALLTREVKENEEYEYLLNTNVPDENCQVTKFQVLPDSLADACLIDGLSLKCEQFNYEDTVFSEIEIPQVQIGLRVDCSGIPPATTNLLASNSNIINNRSKRAISEDGRFYALTADIPFNTNQLFFSLLIADVNDVEPVFVHPATNNILLGYPEPDLSSKILPPYLITVTAVGGDSEQFNKIKYTIENNNNFEINAETGEIYPLRYAMFETSNDNVALVIHATDEDGNGKISQPLNIRVRRLEAKHITMLSIEEGVSAELSNILDHIELQAELKLQVLHSAVVSYDDIPERSFSTKQIPSLKHTTLRMVVYAFDSQQQLIDNDAIHE